MDIKSTVKRALPRCSIYFTILTALYTLMVMIVNVSDSETLLSANQILFLFVFSVLASVAWELFCLEKLHTVLRVLLHYGILLFSFYACFLLPAGMGGSQVFIGIVGFSLLYAIVMGLRALIRARFRANTEKATAYEKQYERRK